MSVIKTPHGYYAFRVYITINGVRKQIYRSDPTWTRKSHALSAQEQFLKSTTNPDPLSFGEVVSLYLEDKRLTLKKNTLYNVEMLLHNHICPTFNEMRIDRILYPNIQTWQRSLAMKPFSNEHMTKIQKTLKSVFHYAYLHDLIDKDPTKAMKYVKVEETPKKRTILTPGEFNQFLSVVDDPIYKTMYLVLYWCGLRIGEACALTFDDVDLAKGTLTVNKTYNFQFHEVHSPKTRNSYRLVEMPLLVASEVSKLIQFYRGKYEHDHSSPLFPMTSFPRMRRRLNEWITLSKSPTFTHHDFRHSCVSLLANAGFNDFQAAKRMGHDVKMFNEVYGHLFDSEQKKMTKAMDKMSKN